MKAPVLKSGRFLTQSLANKKADHKLAPKGEKHE